MSRTNFHGLNLTHFQVLLIVLECGSATRAAHRLSLTPSAISHSLARLREVLGDPLFLRRGNTLEPTARAREIGARIRPLVESLSASLEPPYFDPATATREFRVLASPYALVTLLPDLFETVVPIAPYSSMKLISAHDVPALACLVDGTIDVAIGASPVYDPRIEDVELLADELVWAMRIDHPFASGPIDIPRLSVCRHVVVEHLRPSVPRAATDVTLEAMPDEQSEAEQLERFLFKAGMKRTIGAIVPDTASALSIVSRSDMLTLIPRKVGEMLGGGKVLLRPQVEGRMDYRCHLSWNRDRLHDPAVNWLVTIIRDRLAIAG